MSICANLENILTCTGICVKQSALPYHVCVRFFLRCWILYLKMNASRVTRKTFDLWCRYKFIYCKCVVYVNSV